MQHGGKYATLFHICKMANFSVISVNVQGLGNFQKRRDVFHYLRQKNHSIYFLQDTHFTNKEEKQIRAEWGYECYFASHTSQSRGVCILFNNNFDFKINNIIKDKNGNFIILVMKTMDKNIVLVNLYGPNNDDPQFYEDIKSKLLQLSYTDVIVGGDWNLVLNPGLDYHNYKHVNNPKAQDKVMELSGEVDLVDVWRELNPETLRYTWRRNNPTQQARLDFFLVSDSLLTHVKDAEILIGYRSDHSAISVKLEFQKEAKNNNFWKFNSALLRDKQYVDEVHKVIAEVKEQYSLLVYNREELCNVREEDLEFVISDQLFLDTLFMEIRKKTMEYAARKKREDKKTEQKLEEEIQRLEEIRNKTNEEIQDLINKKENLITLRRNKMQGVLLRSKARWAAEGEKITKYFCSLERRHYVSKQMFKLISKQGETLDKTEDMLQETKDYYQTLYKEKEVTNVKLEDYVSTLPKLTQEEAAMLEGYITVDEAGQVLKNMSNGKSPGTDGMTVDFFKFFWKQLKIFVVRSINEGFDNKQMSITQREGIIICIPKGDKPREYLKNWRPISLLNVAYKIGSSCIANRIKTVLPKLISEDQTGFVPGRYIGDNLRLLYDITHYLNETNTQGLLVALDFEKAFDSVNWNYMHKTLEAFGFGEDIRQWIAAFYSNIKSSVIVNGKASQSFSIGRGCRQGDPISPYLYILCAELLACKIRENEKIKGIKIYNTECKISQFADDTTMLLEGDKESYEELFLTLHTFEQISGLKINYDKTCNVWLGSKINSNVKYMEHINMSWNPPKYKILGLWYTNDLAKMAELNLMDKFNETKKLFITWMKRTITPIGKVAILKSLILSKLIYLWIMLPNPPDDIINQLQLMCYKFIWDKKNDKVKRTTSIHTIPNGGLGIPHIHTYIKSLKLTWLKKCCNPTYSAKWKSILLEKYPVDTLANYGPRILHTMEVSNSFWKDVFDSYVEFYNKVVITNKEEILSEPLFQNDKFKIDGQILELDTLEDAGIYTVKDLVKEDGKFLSVTEFQDKFKIKVPILTYYGYISTIKKYLRQTGIKLETNTNNTFYLDHNKAYNILIKACKGSKIFYDTFLGEHFKPESCNKWDTFLNLEINWSKVFAETKKINEVKLKWFQMKIYYRILVTNSILARMKVMDSNECSFCNQEKDTVYHYLWDCTHVQLFWNDFVKYLQDHCTNCDRLVLNSALVLFGNDNKSKTDVGFRHILLVAKFFIYKCRINKIKPTIVQFLIVLIQNYKIEQLSFKLNMNYGSFAQKWDPYKSLFKE
jgi:exonuclease III